MAGNSGGTYFNATWPIVVGCTHPSPGCLHCWAARDAHRMAGNPHPRISSAYERLTVNVPGEGVKWLGKVRTLEERLTWPGHWSKPRRVLVSSHGDLFHPAVDPTFTRMALLVMLTHPRHTFFVFTKFPQVMAEIVGNYLADWANALKPVLNYMPDGPKLPPHMIMCASAEDQQRLDERWPWLKRVPAMRRGLSLEPLLGPIDLSRCLPTYTVRGVKVEEVGNTMQALWDKAVANIGLSWCVVGCESGPRRRPMEEWWVRSLRDQCQAIGVSFHYKQAVVGKKLVKLPPLDGKRYAMLPGDEWPAE